MQSCYTVQPIESSLTATGITREKQISSSLIVSNNKIFEMPFLDHEIWESQQKPIPGVRASERENNKESDRAKSQSEQLRSMTMRVRKHAASAQSEEKKGGHTGKSARQ